MEYLVWAVDETSAFSGQDLFQLLGCGQQTFWPGVDMALPNGRTSPERIKNLERTTKAVELRKLGWAYADIAQELGYTDAHHAYQTVRRELIKWVREPSREVIDLELARLDGMLKGHIESALLGDVKATETCLKIMDRRSKYLGLDAPTKTVVTTELDMQIAELLSKMGIDSTAQGSVESEV